MKKLFSFAVAMLAALSLNATVVTLNASDFTAKDPHGSIDQTVKGIHVTITDGLINADQVRIYKNQTITIAADSAFTAIVFTCTANGDAQYGPGCFEAQDGYTYKNDQGTWTGSASSAAFKASTAQVRATKIEVYFGEQPAEKENVQATVAEAIIAGNELDSMKTSDLVYEVTGYVVNSQPFSLQYGNQIWFMADDAANTAGQVFEAYSCNAVEAGAPKQVIDGDKVKLTGKLTKYYDKNAGMFIIEIKNGVAEFIEKAEGDHELPVIKVDTITVAEAIAEAQKLTPEEKKTASTEQAYAVKGYIASIKEAYNSQYGNMSFYMSDDATATRGDLQAYHCKISADDAAKAVEGAYVLVTGPISNYNGGTYNSYEIAQGTVEILAEAPVIELDTLNAAQALERAQALEVDAQEKVVVIAYIANIKTPYDATYGNVTVWLNDDPTSTYGDIQAYRAKASEEEGPALAEHDKVMIVGMLSHTTYESGGETKHSYQIAQGAQLTVLEKAQGIENIVLTEKAQKVMVDGVLYIVRDNKMYNVQGTQVR